MLCDRGSKRVKVKRQNRKERYDAEIQKALYEIITERLKDITISGLLTISHVDVSRDLSYAKVYISIYDSNVERKNLTFEQIKNSKGKIRHHLGQMVQMRIIPDLEFNLDSSMEYSDRINKILKEVAKEEK